MDFDLSEDQVALRDAASALLATRCAPTRVRAVSGEVPPIDAELWAAMADQGWAAVEGRETDGGLGLGTVEVAVLCEELGRHLAPVPFGPTVVARAALAGAVGRGDVGPGAALGDGGTEGDGADAWARRLAEGSASGALAWSARPEAVTARPHQGGWRLSGRSDPVVNGPDADVVVVFATTAEGPALFALAPTAAARPARQAAMDRTRSLGWMAFDDTPAQRLGGAAAADDALDRAVVGVCAEMLGAATAVLDMTVQYAKDRVQFGRPIGSFQAVKHRCADMLVDVEGMRSAAYYAAWAVGAGDAGASEAASAAKVWCSDAARRVMASGLQVHGGIGFTWEHDLHLFLKRSQLDQVSLGDAAHHRERLVRMLRPRADSGQPLL
jgi:alkylation response protein AidB-like acyl-CoA dehydrogenase